MSIDVDDAFAMADLLSRARECIMDPQKANRRANWTLEHDLEQAAATLESRGVRALPETGT